MTEFRFRKGDPIQLALDVDRGDPADVTLTVKLKPASGNSVPPESVPSLGEFEPTFVAATDTAPAHWLLAWPDDIALPIGRFVTDALASRGGAPVKVTRHVFFTISASVSG